MHSFRLLIVIQTTFLIFFATTTRARRIAAYLHYFLATLVISSLSKAQLFLPTPLIRDDALLPGLRPKSQPLVFSPSRTFIKSILLESCLSKTALYLERAIPYFVLHWYLL
jgi:hypothetical protein